jgi:hypothetical protein
LCCFMQGCDSWSSKDRKTTKWEKWKLADDWYIKNKNRWEGSLSTRLL